MRRRTDGNERGATLVELLITVWILGAVVVVAAGALFTMVRSSDLARRTTLAEAELRQYTEFVRALQYKHCAVGTDYNNANILDARTTAVHFWNNTADAIPNSFTQTATEDSQFRTQGSCVSSTRDNGVQKLDVSVTVNGSPGVTLTATLLKRDNGTGP